MNDPQPEGHVASHIGRRKFFVTLGGAAIAWPLAARAQQVAQIPQVGWIWPGAAAGNPTEVAGFKQGLRDLGYVEGKNIVVEYRFGENRAERLPELAADLARLNVSVIVALGTFAVRAARRAAPDTPIVFLDADPIGDAFVTNLSRPGGNITGVSTMRLGGKWPELAKEALPTLTRIGYLINPTSASSVTNLAEARRSAEALGMDFRSYLIERPEDLERTFAAIAADGVGFLLLDASHPYPTDWPLVAKLALRHKLPAISNVREFVAAGGLMSYGSNIYDRTRRMAHYVDKILKGARAGDLPVEQPTKFELVVNFKTAKALSLDVPSSLLARADEVIE
jgi:putative tryptophan/tyrosine transport system substrate-binding protein